MKNNLAPPQPSLAFRVTAQAFGPPALEWLGKTACTADQLLVAGTGVETTQRHRAADFLSTFLASGPRTWREIWDAAREHALSERTPERAKSELAIRSILVGSSEKRLSYWLLPGQFLPNKDAPEDAPTDLEPWLAALRDQYPPATPLDDL